MINYYQTFDNKFQKCDTCPVDSWINCIAPTEKEIKFLSSKFNIEQNFLKSALDEQESSRIDTDNEITLIVIDCPVVDKSEKNLIYYTMPLSIFLTKENVITVSVKNIEILNALISGKVPNAQTKDRTRFILNVILYATGKYLSYLNQIIKTSDRIERSLSKSMKNKNLIQLLKIEKSLVYFSSSLKTSKVTVEKLFRGKFLTLHEDDRELLDDVLIEIKQAIEMSDTYLNITTGIMEAFASIISNNLNIVMKILASLTLIISIPTVISGIYGMNTPNFPMMDHWWFPVSLSFILMCLAYIMLKKKDMI
ncbi:MAG: magnesium transporter CorA family protein [Oscillospiraceae bacterium]|jgi:magnesium transporter|nr:magnesium transporter CorA family protein [Oscillospiraceae bacterium]